MLIVIVIVGSTVTVGNVELNDVTAEKIKSLVLAQVNREIVPAGLFILIYKTGCRGNTVAQCIGNRITTSYIFAVIVQYQRIYCVANPCGNIFVGNIYPHTKLGGVFKLLLAAIILKSRHHITGLKRVAVVDVERHSAVTTVNLTGF